MICVWEIDNEEERKIVEAFMQNVEVEYELTRDGKLMAPAEVSAELHGLLVAILTKGEVPDEDEWQSPFILPPGFEL